MNIKFFQIIIFIFFVGIKNINSFFDSKTFPGIKNVKSTFIGIDYSKLIDLGDKLTNNLDENNLITDEFLKQSKDFKDQLDFENPIIEEKIEGFTGSYTQKLFIIKLKDKTPRFIVKVPKGDVETDYSGGIKVQEEISNLQEVMKDTRFNKSEYNHDNMTLKLALPKAIFTYTAVVYGKVKTFYFELIPFAQGFSVADLAGNGTNKAKDNDLNKLYSLVARALAKFHKLGQKINNNEEKLFVTTKIYSSDTNLQNPPDSIQMGDFQPGNIFVDLANNIVTISDLETLGENIKKSNSENPVFWQDVDSSGKNSNDLETVINGYDSVIDGGYYSTIAKWGFSNYDKTFFKKRYFESLKK